MNDSPSDASTAIMSKLVDLQQKERILFFLNESLNLQGDNFTRFETTMNSGEDIISFLRQERCKLKVFIPNEYIKFVIEKCRYYMFTQDRESFTKMCNQYSLEIRDLKIELKESFNQQPNVDDDKSVVSSYGNHRL